MEMISQCPDCKWVDPEERYTRCKLCKTAMQDAPKMKSVNVTYFKKSGKYYTSETIQISTEISGYHALFYEFPKHHRIKDMQMLVQDSGDGLEPYIVPHLYKPKEES